MTGVVYPWTHHLLGKLTGTLCDASVHIGVQMHWWHHEDLHEHTYMHETHKVFMAMQIYHQCCLGDNYVCMLWHHINILGSASMNSSGRSHAGPITETAATGLLVPCS
jgi:hypothetical protein